MLTPSSRITVTIIKTLFRPSGQKLPWGFKCSNCHQVVSSYNDDAYFRVNAQSKDVIHREIRVCSERCAQDSVKQAVLSLYLDENNVGSIVTHANKQQFDAWYRVASPNIRIEGYRDLVMDQRLLMPNKTGTLRVDRRHLSRQGYSIKMGGSGTSTNVLSPRIPLINIRK